MRALPVLGFLGVTLVACGTLIGTSGSDDSPGKSPAGALPPDSGPDGSDNVTVNGGVSGSDGGVGACNDFVPAPSDVYVFVTVDGTPDQEECGDKAHPCTLQQALKQGAVKINLAPGTYPGGIAPASGAALLGGWTIDGSGVWTRRCEEGLVKIVGGDGAVVRLDNVKRVLLSHVNLVGNAKPAESETQYGVFATTSTFTLNRVGIMAGPGGDGVAGPLLPQAVGTGDCTAAGTGDTGAVVTGGTAASIVVGPKGVRIQPAGAGAPGAPGSNGTDPQTPSPTNGFRCAPSADGSVDCTTATCARTPAAGTHGCGGSGGEAGRPGTSGGSSVGIFAGSGSIGTALDGSVKSGAGGQGGAGGAGGLGARGTDGSPGATTTTGCLDSATPPMCTPACATSNPDMLQGGVAGGTGGIGGPGGVGGGGAGGHSYSWAATPDSKVMFTRTTFEHGSAGIGGGPNGPGGVAAEHPE